MKLLTMILMLTLLCVPAQAQSIPYTAELDAQTEIYFGPGWHSGYSKPVGEDGVYTIVEEAYDDCGNLWGRLKSGAGWVELVSYSVWHQVPYTIRLEADADVCGGPGYDYGYLTDVDEDGVYTIVEEELGMDGFLWGRLKSGAGWVRIGDEPVKEPPEVVDVEYTVPLGAWVPVYSAPDYDRGACVGIIGEDGVYTIVHETLDMQDNVWGELKSGMGWIDFDYVRTAGFPPLTAYPAEIIDLENAEYRLYSEGEPETLTAVAFRANEPVAAVELTALRYDESSYAVEAVLCSFEQMDADTYFVAELPFYGDMTAYGIAVTDIDGERRHYAVMLSGRDGSVVMNEYVP